MGWEYTIPGYLIVFGVLALYAFSLIRRGRRAAERLPAEKRRFLD